MNQPHFIDTITLQQLGRGAGMTMWGFRACAQGKGSCACVQKGFDDTFGPNGPNVLECMRFFVHCIARFGRRKVNLACPGHIHITRDEASILAAISASQVGDRSARDAHLSWLLAGDAPLSLKRCIDEIAYGFAELQVSVISPEYEQPTIEEETQLRLVHG